MAKCRHEIEVALCSSCASPPIGVPQWVYMTMGSSLRFHRVFDCSAMEAGQDKVHSRGGAPAEIREVSFAQADGLGKTPCHVCFPAAKEADEWIPRIDEEADLSYRSPFDQVIDLGACLVSQNLNLLVLRGQGRLDQLAGMSAPAVYDQVKNPEGTQRPLDRRHARDAFDYAQSAVASDAADNPCLFPEILLNARDQNVIEVYELADPPSEVDFNSLMSREEFESTLVGLRVRLTDIDRTPDQVSPQISRVDGNHRLAGVDDILVKLGGELDSAYEFPHVPFAMLVGVAPQQEIKLFRDLNGEHKGMETAHLDQIFLRISDPAELKANPEDNVRSLWLAQELGKQGRAFEGMLFRGGSKTGVKAAGGVPPVRINSLKTALKQLLDALQEVKGNFADQPDLELELVDAYWQAVKVVFPEAWKSKSEFILLQTIGLGAFARFGGILIRKAVESGQGKPEFFKAYLLAASKEISLRRSDWAGAAGLAGTKFVADKLEQFATPEAANIELLKANLLKEAGLREKIQVATEEFGD